MSDGAIHLTRTRGRGLAGPRGRWLAYSAKLAIAAVLAMVIIGGVLRVIPGLSIAHCRGTSMEPHFHDGDLIVLRMKSPSQVRTGQIVLFQQDSLPVSHRVIEVGPDRGADTVIVTQGDNNPAPDPPLRLSDIQGRVLIKLPFLGEASRWIGAEGGFYVYYYVVLTLNFALLAVYTVAGIRHLARRPTNLAP